MTAHQLAKALLEEKDLPVYINGWDSDEGLGPFEVEYINYDEDGKSLYLNYDVE